ncbi:MAG: hypothetical protein HKM86_10285, partial [Deltaproteobacteria bacterium]|nr:hypothetical protein [Deltaproteobacteria bacterium]
MDEKFSNVPEFGSNVSAGTRGPIYVASRLLADTSTVFSPGALAVGNGVILAAGSPAAVE